MEDDSDDEKKMKKSWKKIKKAYATKSGLEMSKVLREVFGEYPDSE